LRARRPQRGLTFITVLLLVGVLAGIYWVMTFGSVYWENQEVKGILKEATNFAYHDKNDGSVKVFIMRKLKDRFQVGGTNDRPVLAIDYDPADLRIERTTAPEFINIWFTYQRTVKQPFTGQERQVVFNDHAEQDLSPVKW
jgi:hypothetical protein